MEPLVIAMIALSVCCNLLSFLFGALYGKNSAYKTIAPVNLCVRNKKCQSEKKLAKLAMAPTDLARPRARDDF